MTRRKTNPVRRGERNGGRTKAKPVTVTVEDRDTTAAEPVTVNRVTLDNTVPQGWRNVAVPVQPGDRV